MRVRNTRLAAMAIALAASASLAAQQYDAEALSKFRADRETTLKSDTGWLTVAGLHFLNQGDNRVGSDPSNDIVLDFPSVPRHLGVITLNGTNVRISAAQGQTITINGNAVTVDRRDNAGGSVWRYTGTLWADGNQVSGTYQRVAGPGDRTVRPWRARIGR